ncbi:hypothetical protein CPB83DRAFT_886075 [Crepidotus variabilis]|uniref:Uncharacterized protein n=1 Tax=Crepidotus variabilis TaxID=179855 RepID=A0A9P6E906_9AGAR|nr:hypothetical protein CPB83DRAFT_886075 [Crepidotus variabilis]
MVSSTMMRVYGSSVFSSLTIMTWDFLGHIPEDVRLLQGYRVTLPLIVYLIARISTLAFLLSAIEDGPRLTGGIILARTDALLLIQRGSTSILLYLRVHALYQSNLYVKILFWICLLGVTASCVLKDSMSGICSGIFDVFVFCAIFWKLGWYPDTRVIGGRQQVCWKFRIPFRRKPDHTLTDRILQDSLYYLLVAIALKIFQIPFLVPPLSAVKHPRYLGWYTLTFILDAVLVCIISSKIFRDMKLGLPGLHLETSTTDETSPISVIPLILPSFYEASATLRGGRLGELGIIRHKKQFREDGFCACTDAF